MVANEVASGAAEWLAPAGAFVGGMVLGSLGIVNLCAASATAAFYNVFKVNLLHAVFVVASGVLAERGSC